MVNQSFPEGIVPKSWKSAQITPLLKKPSLDHNVVSSYRPISNLPVLSKLAEKLVLNRVMSYFNNSNLLPTRQSAHRRHHSTETAVTKLYSDILAAADNGKLSLLILLDLLTALYFELELILTHRCSKLVVEVNVDSILGNMELKTTATPLWLVSRVFTDSESLGLAFLKTTRPWLRSLLMLIDSGSCHVFAINIKSVL